MPQSASEKNLPLSEFSAPRALRIVSEISEKPHYTGSANHEAVAQYLVQELKNLGLDTELQEGYSLTEWGSLTKSKNIIATIKGTGTGKSLLLLSHYDSAPHTKSHGAADDASGVATILEGVRAFLYTRTPHANDIIILFTDAEELGLNGAALFVQKHPLAKKVGVVINFEARGTSGPAYMLMEVNQGNAEMLRHFSESQVDFPACNSLMYSIYKMLPNDTDLTVFRENAGIQGFNFAFIDDHFNYHTQQDDLAHLNAASLAHQGSYLLPLMKHLSNADLTSLDTTEDSVYFNVPYGFIHYPFSWNFPLFIIASLLFCGLVFVGFGKRILNGKDMVRGFLVFLIAILVAGAVAFLGWQGVIAAYPGYTDIQQGFTYNGHDYIAAFLLAGLAIALFCYRRSVPEMQMMNYAVTPIAIWILISGLVAWFLPGAGFFIIPTLAALFGFTYFIITQRTSLLLNLLLTIPALVLIVPFLVALPVGLGLKMLYGVVVLSVLLFGLMLPVLGTLAGKSRWAIVMLLAAAGFLVHAHLQSGFGPGRARPNSLLYYYDAEQQKAYWTTYDKTPDEWTKRYLGASPKKAASLNRNTLFSKYASDFSWSAEAPRKDLILPRIDFVRDTAIGNFRYFDIRIAPGRNVNRYDIFAGEKMKFYNLKANGISHLNQKGSLYRRNGKRILSYYVVDNAPLELQFAINRNDIFDMSLLESSFDLLDNPLFSIAKRPASTMPAPFVLNDAVAVSMKIKASPKRPLIVSPPPENMRSHARN
ncbi:peptidase M28 [Flavobacterium magnum]|uniref:Vacuolar membrane protease n=2 Tax=Flavobacterium magnum TaxID=2162713 RepID=A0A2S0RID2_9FLAO|nr:peptidase M28 [Flavobacterium magnum]